MNNEQDKKKKEQTGESDEAEQEERLEASELSPGQLEKSDLPETSSESSQDKDEGKRTIHPRRKAPPVPKASSSDEDENKDENATEGKENDDRPFLDDE